MSIFFIAVFKKNYFRKLKFITQNIRVKFGRKLVVSHVDELLKKVREEDQDIFEVQSVCYEDSKARTYTVRQSGAQTQAS